MYAVEDIRRCGVIGDRNCIDACAFQYFFATTRFAYSYCMPSGELLISPFLSHSLVCLCLCLAFWPSLHTYTIIPIVCAIVTIYLVIYLLYINILLAAITPKSNGMNESRKKETKSDFRTKYSGNGHEDFIYPNRERETSESSNNNNNEKKTTKNNEQ